MVKIACDLELLELSLVDAVFLVSAADLSD
jgi:hypothetical protein